jgi:Do/DeqQ family serine protease
VLFFQGIAHAQDADRQVPQSATQIQLSFAPVVKRVTPSVVNIYAKQVVAQRVMPFFGDPMLQQFFGGMVAPQIRPRVENSLGSGVIVRDDGLIVTNAHVAQNALEINVILSDRREYAAKIVLTDEKSDLALLQIDAKGQKFPALDFADSDVLQVGDLVLAIGNPFGVGQTVTSGIVSAVARTNIGQSGFGYYIQTDAAINPGNSGGALVDMQGRVVGINTMIFSKTGGYMGIGFAVPSNLVKQVLASYASGGKIERAWLGAALQPVTGEIAASLDLDRPQGVLVQKVYADGPAEEAGLKRGDIILSVDGKETDNPETIRYILATKTIGSSVPIAYLRNGEKGTSLMHVVVPPKLRKEEKLVGNHPLNGASVTEITPALLEDLPDVDLPDEGIVLMTVSGTALQLGLRPGDVVTAVNAQPVKTIAQLKKALASDRGWKIDLLRRGQKITAMIRG